MLERQEFEFNDFFLDAQEKILLRGGKPLSITPKAFQLLLVLVENHGRLVEKDKLMNAVWADSFVEEANLAFTIGLLRKAMKDDAQKPQFIETVPKRGYRFIAEVKRVEEKKERIDRFDLIDNNFAAPSNGEIFSTANRPRRANETENQSSAPVAALAEWQSEANASKSEEEALLEFPPEIADKAIAEKTDAVDLSGSNRKIAALAIVLLLVGSIALVYYFFSAKSASVGDKKSIAVLPLKPINTTNRDEIYEIGIADSLIHRISSIKGFVVRPLSATRQYTDIGQDPLAAGQEQKVDYVLASNYQLAGGKIRITSQLLNVANNQIEETYKSEKEAGDVFAMQDAIAGEVGNILSARFATTSSSPKAVRGTTNEEAYRLYLQGMYLSNNRNAADARKAVEALERAVQLDPNYALAWAGKAYAHRAVGNYKRIANTHEEYQKSIEAINKALALNENLSEAYSALCENKIYYEYDFAGAERACQRAVELDPNSSLAHQVYSRYLIGRRRFDEAIAEIKTAIDLEPASVFHQLLYGNILQYARRYPESAAQHKRVLTMDENNVSAYLWLINTLTFQSRESEAFEWFMKSLASQKADEETVRIFTAAYQTSGWQGVLRERVKRFDQSDEVYFRGAAYNAQVGNKDKAFEYLEKSYQRRELWISHLQVDPLLDSLRDDPRFQELVRRVELK